MTDLAALYRELGEALDGLDAASRALGPDDAETCAARAHVIDVARRLYAASRGLPDPLLR